MSDHRVLFTKEKGRVRTNLRVDLQMTDVPFTSQDPGKIKVCLPDVTVAPAQPRKVSLRSKGSAKVGGAPTKGSEDRVENSGRQASAPALSDWKPEERGKLKGLEARA